MRDWILQADDGLNVDRVVNYVISIKTRTQLWLKFISQKDILDWQLEFGFYCDQNFTFHTF